MLRNFYIAALISDIKQIGNPHSIDFVLITGDLVDKGGVSLSQDPYEVFAEEIISPLARELNITHQHFLFIPGNHDIEREKILEDNEYFLANTLTKEKANEILNTQKEAIQKTNNRIERFKNFEKQFHRNTPNYNFSYNQSSVLFENHEGSVGFTLVNDSWRCSSTLKTEQHFIGFNQLFEGIKSFAHKPDISIAAFHHPLEFLNSSEAEEIEAILHTQRFDMAFFGHKHDHKYESVVSANGSLVVINGRSALNNPKEQISRYQPGYLLIDIDIKKKSFTLHARKFIENGYRFDKDVESYPDGVFHGTINAPTYISLSKQSDSPDPDLPSGYRADVGRIVRLLIGKSLYPNQYIFTRELIQNSVDACNRIKEQKCHIEPSINVFVDTEENSFEIVDQGDGMTKRVLNEHFSVIGKSISQEFNENVHGINLISQFGIGFISTFIISEKVQITTKTEEDGQINFEIEDVFKGFTYTSNTTGNFNPKQPSGTSVKVWLKRRHNGHQLLNFIKHYCRHISNLNVFLNSSPVHVGGSWNTENGIFHYESRNSKYQCKLTISNTSRYIIASNRGFLIRENALQIVPFRFPFIIGGEVVFEPRAVDFDLSRTNIMETEKAVEFRKEISIALRILFRESLESKDPQLVPVVFNYLLFYLAHYESLVRQFREHYTDFYSRKELIDLCANNWPVQYRGYQQPLAQLFSSLRTLGISRIFYSSSQENEIHTIIQKYLTSQGNLIVDIHNIPVLLREGQVNINSYNPLLSICQEYGFELVDLAQQRETELANMKILKTDLPEKLSQCILELESPRLKINAARLGQDFKPTIRFRGEYLVNYDYHTFQSLLKNIDSIPKNLIKAYICGLVGTDLEIEERDSF